MKDILSYHLHQKLLFYSKNQNALLMYFYPKQKKSQSYEAQIKRYRFKSMKIKFFAFWGSKFASQKDQKIGSLGEFLDMRSV